MTNQYPLIALIVSLLFSVTLPSNAQELDGNLKAAEALYTQYCSSCHGAKMQAFVNDEWNHGTSDEAITASITNGRGGGAMPAWGQVLSEEQVSALVAYFQYGFENYDKYVVEDGVDPKSVFKSKDLNFRLEPVIEDLEIPWGMAWLPDGAMLITEKKGAITLLDKGGKETRIKNVPKVNDRSQGGLLDVELHPNYASNGWIYISYSRETKIDGAAMTTTAVARYHLDGNELVDEELIWEGAPYGSRRHHYGSRMEFDREGYLFITIGDRGERDVNPQDLTRSPGKVHRIHDDGSIPDDNPFLDQEGAVPSIYSYGHRNPQGLAMDPETGQLWAHEHGPRGGDELNTIQEGLNYGWPTVSYGINYDGTVFTTQTEGEGFQHPRHYWVPSIAPSGMTFVSSDRYPGWKGHLLVGSLRFEYLNLCKIEGDQVVEEEILMKGVGRVRNIRQGPDGYLYVAVEEPGRIYRIVPE